MALVQPGTCRHCGCHGEGHKLANGDECGWTDWSRTVCSAPGCIMAEVARKRRAREATRAAREEALREAGLAPQPGARPESAQRWRGRKRGAA